MDDYPLASLSGLLLACARGARKVATMSSSITTLKLPTIEGPETAKNSLFLPGPITYGQSLVSRAYAPPSREIDRLLRREQWYSFRMVLLVLMWVGVLTFILIELLFIQWRWM